MARYPIWKVLGYYLVLATAVYLLVDVAGLGDRMPTGRVGAGGGFFQGRNTPLEPLTPMFEGGTAAITLIGMLTALLLVLPVAWAYMATKPRKGYDQSVTHTVIILPAVVAGIVLIVRDSISLAFSLGGIVAAVRFRNTLKDTKDAVYVFLAIGVGLASGILAIDVAFFMSLMFNLIVLGLWKFNVGGGYWGIDVANPDTLPISGPSDPNTKRFTSLLTVRTPNPADVRAMLQEIFEDYTKRWTLVNTVDEGTETVLEFAVRFRRSAQPEAVVSEIRRTGGPAVLDVRLEAMPRPVDA